MPSELSYTERDTDLDFSGAFDVPVMDSDLCPSVAAGLVLAEFYCGELLMPIPTDEQITFEVEAIKSPDVTGSRWASLSWFPCSARVVTHVLYTQVFITITDPGNYTFRVHAHNLNEAGGQLICEAPLLPAWLRIVGDVFGPPTPPSGIDVSIRATVGL